MRNTIDDDIKQAKSIAELHRGRNGENGWNAVIERLALEVERLRSLIAETTPIFRKCADDHGDKVGDEQEALSRLEAEALK